MGELDLPVDWTLRTKVRFLSPNPFPWSQKIKTCEEASATTGLVYGTLKKIALITCT